MKLTQEEASRAYEKIEIEQNKIISVLQKFWQFSKFYGNYIASPYSKKKRIFKSKQSNSIK